MDTLETINIKSSFSRPLQHIAMCIMLSVCSIGMVISELLQSEPEDLIDYIAWVGSFVFPLLALRLIWRLVKTGSEAITISPEGLRDRRLANETIPWKNINDVATWNENREQTIVLGIDPHQVDQLGRGIKAKIIATSIFKMPKGLYIDGRVLTTDFDRLFALVAAYHRRYGKPKTI
ncbi:hypothetical protein HB779_14800 [Phyllobacterium sp. 628]|uniref:STM3941 family protein n=1 Tax=Phyllobacterium sp. 628 TaxID=2718938 RepID=UPI001662219F|nr:STM3941 family protein [Phyllobacterium sp. 628]QND53030.1 hypothetical protein HB779_14800 [Phyllobacterium sp. 628]